MDVLTVACLHCGERTLMNVPAGAFMAWKSGEMFIQDAFPDWSPARRELLKSGTHPECWDAMMGDDE